MGAVFLRVLNMSITASWLMAVVILLRFLFKRAPRWISCILWAFVAIRLICPVAIESGLSLVPNGQPVNEQRMPVRDVPQMDPLFYGDADEAAGGNSYDAGNKKVEIAPGDTTAGDAQSTRLTSVGNLPTRTDVAGIVWLCGAAVLIFYSVISYAKLHRRTKVSAAVEKGIWQCDEIQTPFILGMVRPRIYLPSDLDAAQAEYVIAHERAHIKRLDHWWKPLGFLILSIHWFNPLCWVSYILCCRDIELACDENVIRTGDEQYKKSYAEALLACSTEPKIITVCPLAFGETSVKERVRNVMNYKKPAFWIVLAAAAACIVVAVCFLTNPQQKKNAPQAERPEDTDLQDGEEFLASQDGNEHSQVAGDQNAAADVDADSVNGQHKGGNPDDAAGVDADDPDGTDTEIAERGDDVPSVREGVPDEVWEAAEGYVQAAFDRTKESSGQSLNNPYTQWRIENLEHCYTYGHMAGMNAEIYRLNYEFLAKSPEEVSLAGGMSMSADGWVVPESPNCHYLVFIKRGQTLSYFCGMYENDCEPGDELFTSDLLSYCNEMGLYDEYVGFSPNGGKELVERITELESDIEELHAIPYTQDIATVGELAGVLIDETGNVTKMYNPGILCIGELPDQGIRMYGYNDGNYWRQGVAIEMGNQFFAYDWGYMTPSNRFPKLYWDEKKQQLQLTLSVYTGEATEAEKLVILQYNKEKGSLEPYDFKLDEFTMLIDSILGYRFDEESRTLTLIDKRTDREVRTVIIPEDAVYGICGGDISEFVLGDTILLRVTPGYETDGGILQYDHMPVLEFEVEIIERDDNGKLSFTLGALR